MANRPVAGDPDERILLVEDDAAQRIGLQQLLTSWGHTVDVAANGAEALARVAESRPTIVLSDLIMPVMGGEALIRLLRAQGWDQPVVVLSGHALPAPEAEHLSRYGRISFL